MAANVLDSLSLKLLHYPIGYILHHCMFLLVHKLFVMRVSVSTSMCLTAPLPNTSMHISIATAEKFCLKPQYSTGLYKAAKHYNSVSGRVL